MPRLIINQTFARLARAESAFLAAEFLAPVVRFRAVVVSIAGVRCSLRAAPADFRGWGVLRPLSHSTARLVREASADERRRYLDLLTPVRVIVLMREGDRTTVIPANEADYRLQISGTATVQLPEPCDIFDTLLARFDGGQFWFDEVDARADPAAATYLRRELARMTEPARLSRSGLTSAQRQAYATHFASRSEVVIADHASAFRMDKRPKLPAKDRKERVVLGERESEESRLSSALAQAGASLRDFSDGGESYRVTYTVDGHRHVSVIRKNDLTVLSAGICLSGEDRAFDLNSLIGVLREGATIGRF